MSTKKTNPNPRNLTDEEKAKIQANAPKDESQEYIDGVVLQKKRDRMEANKLKFQEKIRKLFENKGEIGKIQEEIKQIEIEIDEIKRNPLIPDSVKEIGLRELWDKIWEKIEIIQGLDFPLEEKQEIAKYLEKKMSQIAKIFDSQRQKQRLDNLNKLLDDYERWKRAIENQIQELDKNLNSDWLSDTMRGLYKQSLEKLSEQKEKEFPQSKKTSIEDSIANMQTWNDYGIKKQDLENLIKLSKNNQIQWNKFVNNITWEEIKELNKIIANFDYVWEYSISFSSPKFAIVNINNDVQKILLDLDSMEIVWINNFKQIEIWETSLIVHTDPYKSCINIYDAISWSIINSDLPFWNSSIYKWDSVSFLVIREAKKEINHVYKIDNDKIYSFVKIKEIEWLRDIKIHSPQDHKSDKRNMQLWDNLFNRHWDLFGGRRDFLEKMRWCRLLEATDQYNNIVLGIIDQNNSDFLNLNDVVFFNEGQYDKDIGFKLDNWDVVIFATDDEKKSTKFWLFNLKTKEWIIKPWEMQWKLQSDSNYKDCFVFDDPKNQKTKVLSPSGKLQELEGGLENVKYMPNPYFPSHPHRATVIITKKWEEKLLYVKQNNSELWVPLNLTIGNKEYKIQKMEEEDKQIINSYQRNELVLYVKDWKNNGYIIFDTKTWKLVDNVMYEGYEKIGTKLSFYKKNRFGLWATKTHKLW